MSSQKYPAPSPPVVDVQPPIATAPLPPTTSTPPDGWLPPNMIYPPGLEYLMDLDYLFVNQKSVTFREALRTGLRNKYLVTDNKGEPVFYMEEDSSGSCTQLCVGGIYRSFEFTICDKNQREVLRLVRPFKCDGCCSPSQVVEVYSGSILLGSVTQEWSPWKPKFYIRDASGQPVLTIKGPRIGCTLNLTFKIKSLDEQHRVGTIRKHWNGFFRELMEMDKFGIHFPRDLDVKIKAVLLGAAILIDFLYFEKK